MNETLLNKILFLLILLIFLAALWLISPTLTPSWKIKLGLDLQGGSRLVLQAKPTPEVQVISRDVLNGVIEIIDNRINGIGLAETLVQSKGSDQIVVEIPGAGATENARILSIIQSTALLEFKEAERVPGDLSLLSAQERADFIGTDGRLDTVKYYDNKGKVIREDQIILRQTVLTGADLKIAVPGTDEYNRPVVSLEFNAEGARKFYTATLRSVGRPLAILLDGKIISAPIVNEAIPGGRAQISGSFTVPEMRDLVIKLRAGALPVPIEMVENKVIGPLLGADSIAKSVFATWVALALVMFVMIFVYRFNGLLADLALIVYSALVLVVLVLMRATLTLPGIAGLILSVGMAVDANVIIFERLKEELRAGLPVLKAIDAAFNKSLSAILDGNITTIIATGFLFWQGTSAIKGFAVTLFVGTALSMFSALVVTRLFMKNAYQLKFLQPKTALAAPQGGQ
ncbi:MAG: protein translocase subunit SecD [Candidatus Margulisbacteria bacterium]|jgi:preprotein translocase subunit SecD|nr:protein translocase subunit SecD [Candidatus Margulisiibacteriota bacterium]